VIEHSQSLDHLRATVYLTTPLGLFRRAIKTHLFLNRVRRLVTLAFSAPYKCYFFLTYLLTYLLLLVSVLPVHFHFSEALLNQAGSFKLSTASSYKEKARANLHFSVGLVAGVERPVKTKLRHIVDPVESRHGVRDVVGQVARLHISLRTHTARLDI